MRSRESELERFKTEIDLVGFAQDQGYVIDRRKSSPKSMAMKHETRGDRILVARNENGHFIYASVHDHSDNGTIIDFCQKRGGGTLGHVRKELRSWMGTGSTRGPGVLRNEAPPPPKLEPVRVDFLAVRASFEAMSPIEGEHSYLTGVRKVPPAVYGHARFQGRLRTDERGNVIFPHWESGGQLTGYEIKNVGWTGFATGGAKRLFASGFGAQDSHLVVCESGIDALSYAALFGIDGRRFVSTAGALNPEQVALLRSAIEKLPGGAEVVLAVDADAGGDALAEQVGEIAGAIGKGRRTIRRDSPGVRGQDWNDVLRARRAASPPPPGLV